MSREFWEALVRGRQILRERIRAGRYVPEDYELLSKR